MIEEILSEIKTAEKSAAQVVAKAEERAEQIRAAADEQCAAVEQKARADAKNYRETAVAEAEKSAAEKCGEYAAETRKLCAGLKKDYRAAALRIADELFRRITNGDC